MLSEISQRKTNTVCYHIYVESKKRIQQISEYNKKERDTENKLVVTSGERKGGVGQCRDGGENGYYGII